jgi:hypothetical protein
MRNGIVLSQVTSWARPAPAGGCHAWSERYDRELADVFAVQDEIAAAITSALHVTLSAGAPARGHRPTLPAYEHYLKGLYHAQRPAPESNALARNHFERAIELDPGFALAHAAIGHLLHHLAVYGFTLSQRVFFIGRSVLGVWLGFAAVTALASIAIWLLASTIYNRWVPPGGIFMQAVVTALVFPIVGPAFMMLRRAMTTAPERL